MPRMFPPRPKTLIQKTLQMCWKNMKQRCYTVSCKNYKTYGARGITVCKRWRNSYDLFYKDMSPTWKQGLSLDRINTYGNYKKSNCQWITRSENSRKKRRRHLPRDRKSVVFDMPVGLNVSKSQMRTLKRMANHRGIPKTVMVRIIIDEYIKANT